MKSKPLKSESVKVQIEIIEDAITKNGRLVKAKMTETDDQALNNYLNLPKVFVKTFQLSQSINDIRQHFLSEVTNIIESSKSTMEKQRLIGKKMEFSI